MTDFTLQYAGYHIEPEDLKIGECTIRPTRTLDGQATYYRLWFYVARNTDGAPEMFGVALIVNGSFTESGPGGRSWGFTRASAGAGAWQISPSINVLGVVSRETHAGEHPSLGSVWHHTPIVVDVPDGEPWQ